MKRPGTLGFVGLILGATFVALAVTGVAVLMLVAGGHGWNASALSATTLVTAPSGALAWLLRRSRLGQRLAVAALSMNLAADILFVILSAREGWEYAGEAWEHMPNVVVGWIVAWILLQAIPIAALRRSDVA